MVPEGKPGKRRYGMWAGEPRGQAENIEHCIEAVAQWNIPCQCSRKRGYGPNAEFCKQHAKIYESRHRASGVD